MNHSKGRLHYFLLGINGNMLTESVHCIHNLEYFIGKYGF